MKKTIFFALSFIVGMFANAQPKSVFGLTLGETYQPETTLLNLFLEADKQYAVVPNYEPYSDIKDNPLSTAIDAKLQIRFLPVEENSSLPMILCDFSSAGTLVCISELYLADSYILSRKDTLRGRKVFKHLRDSLSKTYPMKKVTKDHYSYIGDHFDITMSYGAKEERSSIMYCDKEVKINFLKLIRSEIQSTFFGLTLGNAYSTEEVRHKVNSRGSYRETKRNELGNSIVAVKVLFGGHIWEFCEIYLSPDGVFYNLELYDSYPIYYESDRNADLKLYKEFKAKLEAKYNTEYYSGKETRKGNNFETAWVGGDNDTMVTVYKRISKSVKGENRSYVGLNYTRGSVLHQVDESINEEL